MNKPSGALFWIGSSLFVVLIPNAIWVASYGGFANIFVAVFAVIIGVLVLRLILTSPNVRRPWERRQR